MAGTLRSRLTPTWSLIGLWPLVLALAGPAHAEADCPVTDVDLTASAGTGYQWSLQPDDAPLDIVSRRTSLPSGALGGPQVTHFGVKPREAGDFKATFVLTRPWEKNVEPAETKTVDVSCSAPATTAD